MSQLKDFYIYIPKKLIFISFIFAMMVDFIPIVAQLYWLPDMTLLLLICWLASCPHFIGVGWAFSIGLLVDIGTNSPLGGHALAYIMVAYLVISNHRQFGVQNHGFQSLLVWLAVLVAEAVLVAVGWFSVGKLPDWSVLIAPVLGAVLWLIINQILNAMIHSQRFR